MAEKIIASQLDLPTKINQAHHVIWNDSTQGMTYEEVPIPADMKEDVDYWRGQLIEAVAEYDDKLMEKFFENPDSISENEIHEAIRKATEAAKRRLTDAEETTVSFGGQEWPLTRARFEELVRPIVERTGASCRQALRDG